jgi:hypothetical protein
MNAIEKIHQDFTRLQQQWAGALNNYTESDLLKKVTADSWTLGQVYVHLISSVLNFHLKQVETCLASAENREKKKNFKGFMVFNILNGFPPTKIKVPPSDAYTPRQPQSKKELLEGFEKVASGMKTTLAGFQNNLQGKTAHPALGFLSAKEWYKMIPMHWKHHLRQKKSIDQA